MFILEYTKKYIESIANNPKKILAEMVKSNNTIVNELYKYDLWTLDLRAQIIACLGSENAYEEGCEIDEDYYGITNTDEKSSIFYTQYVKNHRFLILLNLYRNDNSIVEFRGETSSIQNLQVEEIEDLVIKEINKLYLHTIKQNYSKNGLIFLAHSIDTKMPFLINDDSDYLEFVFKKLLNDIGEEKYLRSGISAKFNVKLTSVNVKKAITIINEIIDKKNNTNANTINQLWERLIRVVEVVAENRNEKYEFFKKLNPLLKGEKYNSVDKLILLMFCVTKDVDLTELSKEDTHIDLETFFLDIMEDKEQLNLNEIYSANYSLRLKPKEKQKIFEYVLNSITHNPLLNNVQNYIARCESYEDKIRKINLIDIDLMNSNKYNYNYNYTPMHSNASMNDGADKEYDGENIKMLLVKNGFIDMLSYQDWNKRNTNVNFWNKQEVQAALDKKIVELDDLLLSAYNKEEFLFVLHKKNYLKNKSLKKNNSLNVTADNMSIYKDLYFEKYLEQNFGKDCSGGLKFNSSSEFRREMVSKNLSLKDYEENIFKKMVMNFSPFTDGQIKSVLAPYSEKSFEIKNNFLLYMYEKTIDDIGFFWQKHIFLDAKVIKQYSLWFTKNKHRISNLDLQILSLKKDNIINNLIIQEIKHRKINNIFVEKKYMLSTDEQKELFMQDTSLDLPESYGYLSLINFEHLKNMKIGISSLGYSLMNEEIRNLISDCAGMDVLSKQVTLLKDIFVEQNQEGLYEEVDLEEKSDIWKNITIKNIEFPLPEFTDDKKEVIEIIKSLMKNSIFETISLNMEYLTCLIYNKKLSVATEFEVDELSFWRAYVLSDFLSLNNDFYQVKEYASVKNSRAYIIPKHLHSDKMINIALELYKKYQKHTQSVNYFAPAETLCLKQQMFYLAKDFNIIPNDAKMIINGRIIESDINSCGDISMKDMYISGLCFDQDYSEGFFITLYEKIFSEIPVSLKNMDGIIKNKNLIIPKIKKETNISMQEKMKIFNTLITNVFLEHSDVERQLNSFCNYLDFLGGRKEVLKYIDEHPEDENLSDELCVACFYFVSLIAKEEADPRLIDFIRGLEYVTQSITSNSVKHIFSNKIYNMQGLIREVNLKEALKGVDIKLEMRQKKKV